jgi:curli biogenesis system outer membrane secretion channel CsgG
MNRSAIPLLSILFSTVLFIPSGEAQLDKLFGSANKTKTENDSVDSRMPEYHGVKHALGVLNFDNQAGYFSEWNLGENLRLMLESALYDSGRFVIVERAELGAVLNEQDLQASGRSAQADTVAQTGKIRSARYLATGAITEASYENSGEAGGINIKGFRIGGSSEKADIVAVVKIIDTTSGEVIASKRVRGEAGKTALNVRYTDYNLGGNLGAFAKTPLGEAAQDVINAAVEFIAAEMEDYEVEAAVVTVSGERVIISIGENFGVEEGQHFIVRTDGEILTDPTTGEVLDRLEGEVTATIEVNSVREKIAYCKLVDGEMPERGDTVIHQ